MDIYDERQRVKETSKCNSHDGKDKGRGIGRGKGFGRGGTGLGEGWGEAGERRGRGEGFPPSFLRIHSNRPESGSSVKPF
jgi:hypothetical protein